MNVKEGGNFAGAAKFSFRQTDDPRYTDRRMKYRNSKVSPPLYF
jgi:hypothetical protein